MQCLLACRVKFIHVARFLSYVVNGTESPILAFPGLVWEHVRAPCALLLPTRRPKDNLVGALCHDLVVGACTLRSNRVLVSLSQPRGLLGFHMRGGAPVRS